MKIFGIRHLPTIHSNKGLLLGSMDEPIASPTVNSLVHLKRHHSQLAGVNLETVVTSSLLRTQQTAKLFGYTHFVVDKLADELNFGVYEGRFKTQLIKDYGSAWYLDPAGLPLGESLHSFRARIMLFFEKYKHMNNLLLFGHGAWLRAACALGSHGDINKMNQMEIKPGDMVVIEC